MVNDTKPSQIKKKQHITLLVIVGGLLLLLYIVTSLQSGKETANKAKDKVDDVNLASPLAHADVQSIWLEQAQNQVKKQTEEIDALQQQMQLLQQGKDNQDKSQSQEANQITQLQSRLNSMQRNNNTQNNNYNNTTNDNAFPAPPGSGNQNINGLSDSFIQDDTLALTPQKTALDLLPIKNPNTFVPAGTFARAIMIGGADASASVTSQANPEPMLFRILDQGTLPNHAFSHLKNCVATAAVIGDISSERGEIRLERLSCTQPNGNIVEIPVEGTVFGPDGKNGVRGNPVWREGALLERAFVAGTLSGFSNGISEAYTTSSISPLGTTTTVDNGKIAQYGLASGVGSAAEKLADYNIQRAEQYHPVIQISAGTQVDLVFLKGFFLDGKKHDENEDNNAPPINPNSDTPYLNVNSNNPNGLPNQHQTPSPLALTPQQIDALKQKDAQQGYF